MKSQTAVLNLVRKLRRETHLCGNVTYYPASWVYGFRAGSASTSARGDARTRVAALRAAQLCGIPDDDCGGLDDCRTIESAVTQIMRILERIEAVR